MTTTDPHELVRQLIGEHLSDADLDGVTDDTPIATLGDEDAVDEFYDALDDAVDGTMFLSDREEKLATVGGIVEWIRASRKEKLASGWHEAITPLQQKLLAGSWAFGMVLIVVAILWKAEGQALNQPLFALGIFIAAQLKFGIAAVYEWLAKNSTALVERVGHARLFWWVLIGAYLLSFLEIGLVLAIFGVGG